MVESQPSQSNSFQWPSYSPQDRNNPSLPPQTTQPMTKETARNPRQTQSNRIARRVTHKERGRRRTEERRLRRNPRSQLRRGWEPVSEAARARVLGATKWTQQSSTKWTACFWIKALYPCIATKMRKCGHCST